MKRAFFKGRVVHGKAVGRTLGVPTLNFDTKPEGLDFGVYVGIVRIVDLDGCEQKKYSSIANWGPQPTFNGAEPLLEVHVLDFSDELYGKEVSFEFLKKIRDIQAFESSEALKVQIQKDLVEARAFFENLAEL